MKKKSTKPSSLIKLPPLNQDLVMSELTSIAVRMNTLNQRIFNLETALKEQASQLQALQETQLQLQANSTGAHLC